MANVIPFAFRGELFTGTHNFASGGEDDGSDTGFTTVKNKKEEKKEMS